MEIWAFSRTNPFNPWPGLNFDWYRQLSHYAIKKYLAIQDEKAQRKGMRSSWHRVATNTMQRTVQSPIARDAGDTNAVNAPDRREVA